MYSVRETATRNSQSLQDSLNGIFLAIGNAYYEANMALKSSPSESTNTTTKSSPIPSLFSDSDLQIKHQKAAFLDSLDQLEILAMRATEVLERRGRIQLRDAQSFLVTPAATATTTESLEVPSMGPTANDTRVSSPEVALINDVPHTTTQDVSAAAENGTAQTNNHADSSTNGQVNGETGTVDGSDVPTVQVNGDSVDAALAMPDSAVLGNVDDLSVQFANPDDIMNLDGSIDFGMGDMMFENFNFDDTTQFDFGSMMED